MWRCYSYENDPFDDDALAEIAEDVMRLKQGVNLEREWPPPGPEDMPNEHIKPNAKAETSERSE